MFRVSFMVFNTMFNNLFSLWYTCNWKNSLVVKQQSLTRSVGFTYGLDRLKPRASKFKGPPAKVSIIFITVIGLSHLCCYNVLYFRNNHSVIFLTQLHSISKYCTILNISHQLPVLQLIKHTSIFLQSWRWGTRKGLTSGLA